MKNFYRKSGFTVIEIMLVVAIIGIMSAIAIPTYLKRLHMQRLNAGVSQVLTHLRMARQSAKTRHLYYRLNFQTYENAYLMEKSSDKNSWQSVETVGNEKSESAIGGSAVPNLIYLPKDIRLADTTSDIIMFTSPNGTVDPAFLPASVVLKSKATNKSVTIEVNFTGIPMVE